MILHKFCPTIAARHGINAAKRRFYKEHEIYDLMDRLGQENMLATSEVQSAYAAFDAAALFRLFLLLTPDSGLTRITHSPAERPGGRHYAAGGC